MRYAHLSPQVQRDAVSLLDQPKKKTGGNSSEDEEAGLDPRILSASHPPRARGHQPLPDLTA